MILSAVISAGSSPGLVVLAPTKHRFELLPSPSRRSPIEFVSGISHRIFIRQFTYELQSDITCFTTDRPVREGAVIIPHGMQDWIPTTPPINNPKSLH